MTEYKLIFEAVESTLMNTASARMPPDVVRAKFDDYKHREARTFSDNHYYDELVEVVFYSGFRAETATRKLPIIRSHFPTFRAVAQYNENDIALILADPQMIRNRRKITACISNAKTFASIIAEYGSFQSHIDSFHALRSDADLMRLKEALQGLFQGLGGITTYHFLTGVGMPVLKPDRVVQRIFKRPGLLDDSAKEEDFIREGRKFAESTGLPMRYIDIVFVCHGQEQSTDVGIERGICVSAKPSCSLCGVTRFCKHCANNQ